MADYSLTSLLGDKSPRRVTTETSVSLGTGLLMSDRSIGPDDTRMSFLNRLDVGDLGVSIYSC